MRRKVEAGLFLFFKSFSLQMSGVPMLKKKFSLKRFTLQNELTFFKVNIHFAKATAYR